MLIQHKGKTWFFEDLYDSHGIAFEVREVLVAEYDTGFQKLMVLDTKAFGKVLVLDGVIQLAEIDEHIYHESMAHTALMSHNNPKRVLIIGGGDCGIAREVLKHSSVEAVYVIDIDPDVTRIAKQHFPGLTSGVVNDQRLTIMHRDATAIDTMFIEGEFDVVLMDTTDNQGVATGLFGLEFTQKVHSLLKEDGILIRLGGSMHFQSAEVGTLMDIVTEVFGYNRTQLVHFAGAATYYGGPFFLIITGKGVEPKYCNLRAGDIKTKWYSREMHFAMQILPKRFE